MTSYCETCASIANVYWNYRLFLNEHDAKYYDVLERVLYNGVISGVSLSGDKFFYDNPLESEHNHHRAPWFGCACCPGNITRFMASVPGYMYATDRHSVYVNLFAESNAKIPFGNDTVAISQTTKYPWNGDVVIKIDRPATEKMNLKIRIPGWAQNQPVPSDLYHFRDQLADSFTLKINGEAESAEIENGYINLHNNWKSGDEIVVSFPMPVRKIVANENVPNDKGKLAYQRGPVVYCFEDKDNNNSFLFDCFANPDEEVNARFDSELLGGVVKLQLNGASVEVRQGEKEVDPVSLTAIPYYAWNNRGASNMMVWLPDGEATVVVKPEQLPSNGAKASASTDWAPGLNDGFDPKSSADTDKSYFYWWLKEGTEEWVQYDFKKPVSISKSEVYWLNMDHYDGNYRVPENWTLEYKNNKGNWVPVETSDPYGVALDQYNPVNFKPVKTTAIRLNAKLQEGESAGILEWKVSN
jgi:hypothetical protein